MGMEINVINNKIFTEIYLKIKVKGKPHERMNLLITASVNIYQTKKSIPIVMKTCFSYGKLMKQYGNPLSKRTPYF